MSFFSLLDSSIFSASPAENCSKLFFDKHALLELFPFRFYTIVIELFARSYHSYHLQYFFKTITTKIKNKCGYVIYVSTWSKI